jgi:hypothetical protein
MSSPDTNLFVDPSIQSQPATQMNLDPVAVQPGDDLIDPNFKVTTFGAFEEKYPKLAKTMKMSIANDIISDMKEHNERMRKNLKEMSGRG